VIEDSVKEAAPRKAATEVNSLLLKQRMTPKLLKNNIEISLGSFPHDSLYPEQQWGTGVAQIFRHLFFPFFSFLLLGLGLKDLGCDPI